jgi:WD40 repeat protein
MTIESPWGEGLHGRLKLDGEIEFMRLACDGRTLAIGLSRGDQHHGRLLLYDWQSRKVLFRYDEPRQYASFSSVAFPNDRFVVLACSSKVVAIDRQTNEATKLIELSDGSAASVDVSSDGQRLVLGVIAWNGSGRIELYDLHLEGEHPHVEHPRRLPLEHHGGVRSVAFAPNDRWIASTDERGGVCISHGLTGELKHAGELPERRGGKGEVGYIVSFSPDSQTVAAGGALGVVLFDVESGERRVLPEEHKRGVMSLAFSPDGTQLASGVPDGIRLWNVGRGWQVGPTREAHECNVICGLAYAKDRKTLISAGFDRRIEFWSLKQ